ncbi:hypothetical protein D3C86_1941150 [compost metagenome]
MPATTGNFSAQFGEAEVFPACQLCQQFLPALLAAFCERQVRERPVQWIFRQVEVAQHAPKQSNANFRLDQSLKCLKFFLRLLFR